MCRPDTGGFFFCSLDVLDTEILQTVVRAYLARRLLNRKRRVQLLVEAKWPESRKDVVESVSAAGAAEVISRVLRQ